MKILLLCSILMMGCSTAAEMAANAIGGALGNMIDRRIEDKLGNDAGLSDEMSLIHISEPTRLLSIWE